MSNGRLKASTNRVRTRCVVCASVHACVCSLCIASSSQRGLYYVSPCSQSSTLSYRPVR